MQKNIRLRRLIERLNISQREAAKLIGVKDGMMRSYLADREHARSAFTAPPMVELALIALAAAKGVDIDLVDAVNQAIDSD